LKLAREMGMTADELAERMSGDEFLDHMADMNLGVTEAERDDVRAAAIMELLAAMIPGAKLDRKRALKSLLPRSHDVPQEMPDHIMMAALRVLDR